jgi:hypothetical protein
VGDINGFVMEDCFIVPNEIEFDLATDNVIPWIAM